MFFVFMVKVFFVFIEVNNDGLFVIGGCDVRSLTVEFGMLFYVYDAAMLWV